MKGKLEQIPRALKAQIFSRFLIGFISLIAAVAMLAIARDFILGLPCLLLFGYMAYDGGKLLYFAYTGKYVTVTGECIGIERTSLRKRVKSIYIHTEKGNMKVPVRKRLRKLAEGDVVSVYMSPKNRIYESNDGLAVFGYYAIDVIRQSNRFSNP